MKNKTLILARVMLKNGGGFGFNLKNKGSLALLLLVLFVSLPIMIYGLVEMIAFFYEGLAPIGQEGVLLSWGLVMSSLMVLFFGIFHVVSSFYFAKDIETYLPMPVRPRQIVGAKFLVILLYEYLLISFIYLPIVIYFGVREGCGLLYYLYALLAMALLPVLPLALGTLMVMLIMRMINLTRYRELLRIIGGTFAIFLGLAVSFAMQKFNQITPDEIEELVQAGSNSLALLETKLFPTVRWAVQALLHYQIASGLTSLLIFVGLSLVIFAALLLLAELVYIKGVIGISEAGSRRQRVREDDLVRLVKRRPALAAYLLNEIKLLLRTPVYFLNCILPEFIWPVFFVFSFIVVPDRDSTRMLAALTSILNDPNTMGAALGVTLAILAFIGGSNGITATSISREGKELYIKRYIPVSYRQQLMAKLLSGIVMGYAGVVPVILVLAVFLKVPAYFTAIVMILALLPLTLTSMCGLLLDLLNPKLEWDTEQKAVKQNINVFFTMLFSIAVAVIMIAVSFILDLTLAWALIVLPVILLAGCIGFYYLLATVGVAAFRNREG